MKRTGKAIGSVAAIAFSLALVAILAASFLGGGHSMGAYWIVPVLIQGFWSASEGCVVAKYRPVTLSKQPLQVRFPLVAGIAALLTIAVTFLDMYFRSPELLPGNHSQTHFLIWMGTAVATVGIGLRLFAIRQLGPRFKDEIAFDTDQEIETSGIYSLLSHPAEVGFGLAVLGTAVAAKSLAGAILWTLLLLPLMLWRVHRENQLIAKLIGKANK